MIRWFLLFILGIVPLFAEPEVSVEVGPETGLKNPFGVAFDKDGGMYIAEYKGGRLWRWYGSKLHRLAEDVNWNGMHNVCRTATGDLYISDTRNNLVRKVDGKTGETTIVAGTRKAGFNGDGVPAVSAQLNDPISISLSPDDKRLYVADIRNRRARVINLETGIINTVAGNGEKGNPVDGAVASRSPLRDPRAVEEDSNGCIYILERSGHRLRVVRPGGTIHTVAGTGKPHAADGPGLSAGLNGPKHLCMDTDGSVIIADAENHLIRRYDPESGKLTTILGHGKIKLNRPHGVWVDEAGTLWVCDSWNDRVLKVVR